MTAKKSCSFPVLNSAGDLSSDYAPSGRHNDGLWQHIPLRADYVQVFTNIDGSHQDFYQEVTGFVVNHHLKRGRHYNLGLMPNKLTDSGALLASTWLLHLFFWSLTTYR